MAVAAQPPRVGELLRTWRQRRKLSQLELSLDSAVSPRHLSFIETGRARPSREMVLHLADQLMVPLRERNGLLLAAAYAPIYGERSLAAGPPQPETAFSTVSTTNSWVIQGWSRKRALATPPASTSSCHSG